jgi:lysophospholipase L1-like esterase
LLFTMRRSLVAAAVAVSAVVLAVSATPASADTGPMPNSMAATGDSMTQAYNVDIMYAGRDNPQFSWSTGTDPAVNSHYQRILAANPKINGNGYNYAVTGAKMAALDGQLKSAATQKVDYVTVLMGGNDVCAPSIDTMTPVATFQAQFQQAMSNYVKANPRGRIFVSSIPSIYRMWSVLHDDPSAAGTWQYYGICQSMLSASNTDTDRRTVLAREIAFNKALAIVCGKYNQCQWDGNAAFDFNLAASDFDTADYFHPSISGQNTLASVSWGAGFWSGRG